MLLNCRTLWLRYDPGMDANTVSQAVTVALAVLAIIWNQQRSTDKLRDRLDASDREHRAGLDEVKQRLSRIEGFLGVGMPAAAASEAPGADLPSKPPRGPGGD